LVSVCKERNGEMVVSQARVKNKAEIPRQETDLIFSKFRRFERKLLKGKNSFKREYKVYYQGYIQNTLKDLYINR